MSETANSLADLETFILHGRAARLGASAGPPLVRDAEDREELCQDVFIKVHQHLPGFNAIAHIHHALDDLAADTEGQFSLHACLHITGQGHRSHRHRPRAVDL